MRKRLAGRLSIAMLVAALIVLSGFATSAGAAAGGQQLDAYTAVVQADEVAALAQEGFDVTDQRQVSGGVAVDLVATPQQRAKLAREGIKTTLTRVKGGKTVRQFAAAQAADGFQVWRSWDEPGGFEDQMREIARRNPQIAKLVDIGDTIQGRDILAIKLTQGARDKPDGSRPAVLYSATQHAREWIAGEVDRRLMNWYIDRWRANDKNIKRLLKTTELWFVPVANPDGYQYTFDHERLWRKNLRDNNGDDQITVGDGVDLNRNFPNHFKYDQEGSSSILSSDTYRGESPVSEPETAAMKGLLDRIGFAFQVNYHSNGQWLLYAEGWQIATPTADDPIYYAMSGNLDDAGDRGLPPGAELGRPLRHQRRDDRLCACGRRNARLDAGALGGLRRLWLRVPRRRAARPGGVRAQPAVRPFGRRVGQRSRRSRDGDRDRDQAVLPEERGSVQGRNSRARTSRSTTPTATRSRSRCWPSAASVR